MKTLSLITLLLALPVTVLANGGGYALGLQYSGQPAPFQPEGTEHIQIVKEDLEITLGEDAALVSVRYVMRNTSAKRVKVTFGFPVEEVADPYAPTDDAQRLASPPQSLRDYKVEAGEKPVKHRWMPEPFATGKIKPFPGSEALEHIKGWYVSKVTFGKNAEHVLTIHYQAPYHKSKRWVSSDATVAPSIFRYRLSTGAVWQGPILNGTVRVSARGLSVEDVRITKPPSRFERQPDGSWVWQFDQLEPTLADDIEIEAIPGYSRIRDKDENRGHSIAFLERKGRWHHEHRDYKVTASSELQPEGPYRYGAANLTTPHTPHTIAWAEGVDGPGIGEHLDFTFASTKPLTGIVIYPGYGEDNLFQANHRPAKIKLTLNGKLTRAFNLKDKLELQTLWFPEEWTKTKVRHLRLSIDEVYQGERYDDTCISAVHFITPLAKKPVIRGAR